MEKRWRIRKIFRKMIAALKAADNVIFPPANMYRPPRRDWPKESNSVGGSDCEIVARYEENYQRRVEADRERRRQEENARYYGYNV